jgi:hypothetical protein
MWRLPASPQASSTACQSRWIVFANIDRDTHPEYVPRHQHRSSAIIYVNKLHHVVAAATAHCLINANK